MACEKIPRQLFLKKIRLTIRGPSGKIPGPLFFWCRMKLYKFETGGKKFMALTDDVSRTGQDLLAIQMHRTLKIDMQEAVKLVRSGPVKIKNHVYEIAFSTEDGVVL